MLVPFALLYLLPFVLALPLEDDTSCDDVQPDAGQNEAPTAPDPPSGNTLDQSGALTGPNPAQRATFYDVTDPIQNDGNEPGKVACEPKIYTKEELYIAVGMGQDGGIPQNCGRKIKVSTFKDGQVKTEVAPVVDSCTGCEPGYIDLSIGLKDALGGAEALTSLSWTWIHNIMAPAQAQAEAEKKAERQEQERQREQQQNWENRDQAQSHSNRRIQYWIDDVEEARKGHKS